MLHRLSYYQMHCCLSSYLATNPTACGCGKASAMTLRRQQRFDRSWVMSVCIVRPETRVFPCISGDVRAGVKTLSSKAAALAILGWCRCSFQRLMTSWRGLSGLQHPQRVLCDVSWDHGVCLVIARINILVTICFVPFSGLVLFYSLNPPPIIPLVTQTRHGCHVLYVYSRAGAILRPYQLQFQEYQPFHRFSGRICTISTCCRIRYTF